MRVRAVTKADADSYAAVIEAVAGEGRWLGTEAPVDVAQLAARVRAGIDDRDGLWVLEHDDGPIVGTLWLQPSRTAGVISLGMCIVAAARRRGGGRMLMDAAIAWLRDSAAHKVELEVWPDNEPAISLYAGYGFEVEGLRRDHYRRRDGSLRSALIMARVLGP